MQFTRLAYRKVIYRRADFIECGAAVRDHRKPATPFTLTFEVVSPDDYDGALTSSPHLSKEDVEYFRSVDAQLLVVRDGDDVAAMNWFVCGAGTVWVQELRRELVLLAGEHFSCKTFVDPAYRGRALFEHMVWHYARTLDAENRIWGLVLTRNAASLRSLGRNGWMDSGSWTARVRFGRFSARYEAHEPRPLPT